MSRTVKVKKVMREEKEETLFCDLCGDDLEKQDRVFGRQYDTTVERVMYIYPDASERESYDVCYECWGKHIMPIFKKPPQTMDT